MLLAGVMALLLAGAATAATRYAAPGGTGSDPCANPKRPCSVYIAAAENAPRSTIEAGDVVELAPGTYHAEEEGEFGYIPPVHLPEGVTVRGEPGKARPLIVVAKERDAYGSFYVPTGAEVSGVEIRNLHPSGSAIEIAGGTIDRVIARSLDGEFACGFSSGIVRSSACIGSNGTSAIGVNNTATSGELEGVIRNSTLIGTGPGSVGMNLVFSAFKQGLEVNIDAVGVIARGEEADVVAYAWALNKGRGSDLSVSLRSSNYTTVDTDTEDGGTVSVTRPGTDGNIKALPLLGRGNLHQLPGSPTVDGGAIDAASGPFDVDGELWTTGAAPDIGADELGLAAAGRSNRAPDTQLELGREVEGLVVNPTPVRVAEFVFGSSEIGSRFECKLDGGPYRACASPLRRKVAVGRHRFQVRAVDPQGQVDQTPAMHRWSVITWREFRRWIRSVAASRERIGPGAGAARR